MNPESYEDAMIMFNGTVEITAIHKTVDEYGATTGYEVTYYVPCQEREGWFEYKHVENKTLIDAILAARKEIRLSRNTKF